MTTAQETKEFIVKRDGDRDIEFTGHIIGKGGMHNGLGERSIDVTIFRTRGGRYVVATTTWTDWTNGREDHSSRAGVCANPGEVLRWLRQDAGGALGPASKDALKDAARLDPGFAEVFIERID